MCLYPQKMKNRKFTATKKNGGVIPDMPIVGYNDLGLPIYDTRVGEIMIDCGQCIECRQKKAREWQVRLAEEIKDHKYNYFITLTFAPKQLEELCKKTRLKECNAVAGYAVRHMLERWRKDNKKSIKHWLITELGHEGTERIHLHGLLFTDKELEFGDLDDNKLRTWKYWKYGQIYVGDYVNQQTINYISKYITKIDSDHKGFVGQILASPGIGRSFVDRYRERNDNTYQYRPRNTIDFYRLPNGSKVKLPKYYKNHLLNEDERQQIWREYMDLNTETIAGNTYSKKTITEHVRNNIRDNARELNRFLEYGDNSGEWRKRDYNVTRRMLEQVQKKKHLDELRKKLLQELEETGQTDERILRILEKNA